MLSLSSLMAQLEPVRQISDDTGSTLSRRWSRDSSGRSTIQWELLLQGGRPESIHVWAEPKGGQVIPPAPETSGAPGGVSDFLKDNLDMGYPSPRLFQAVNGVLDVLVLNNPNGVVGLAQFQKSNEAWLWTKWVPLTDYAMNSYPLAGRWLGPGKIEVWIPATQGDPRRSTFEMTGFFDEAHPEKQIALKNGKPYPSLVSEGSPQDASTPGSASKASSIDSKEGATNHQDNGSPNHEVKEASKAHEKELNVAQHDQKAFGLWPVSGPIILFIIAGLVFMFWKRKSQQK